MMPQDEAWRAIKNFERAAHKQNINHGLRFGRISSTTKQKLDFVEHYKFQLFLKYNPSQARVPAGQTGGGQWAGGGATNSRRRGGMQIPPIIILPQEKPQPVAPPISAEEPKSERDEKPKTAEEIEAKEKTDAKIDKVFGEKVVKDRITKGNLEHDVIPNGTQEDADKDFDKLAPKNVRDITNSDKENIGRAGELDDGRRVIVRSQSRDNRPTIEIQRADGKRKLREIRYGL